MALSLHRSGTQVLTVAATRKDSIRHKQRPTPRFDIIATSRPPSSVYARVRANTDCPYECLYSLDLGLCIFAATLQSSPDRTPTALDSANVLAGPRPRPRPRLRPRPVRISLLARSVRDDEPTSTQQGETADTSGVDQSPPNAPDFCLVRAKVETACLVSQDTSLHSLSWVTSPLRSTSRDRTTAAWHCPSNKIRYAP